MNTKKLSDKVALVTGGTSGIGKTTATEFARAGAKVVLSGRREKEGANVVAEIQQLGGAAAFIRAEHRKRCRRQSNGRLHHRHLWPPRHRF